MTPRNLWLPEHRDRFTKQLAGLNDIPGIAVLPVVGDDDGQAFFAHPVEQWPEAGGDPVEVLGLGTWDPLLNLDDDFAVVYEQPAMS